MKQYEAVIQTLEKLGGQATLAELYQETLKIKDCDWGTKTPFASIRRIVQTRPEIFKVRPGLWALRSHQARLGLVEETEENKHDPATFKQNHSYYQGIILSVGNLRGYETFAPQQDKNKLFVTKPIKDIRTLAEIPQFSYDFIVNRCQTIDAVWFNQRGLPDSLFEVEHSTDIQNSLLKFNDLQDFYTRMIIVANDARRKEFEQKIRYSSFEGIKQRVKFLGYASLIEQYENEVTKQKHEFLI
jgi:hypothetical protein